MTPAMHENQVESKRVAIACQRCRQSKVKCSGTFPCDRCRKKSITCTFDELDAPGSAPESGSSVQKSVQNKRPQVSEHQPASKKQRVDNIPAADPLLSRVASGQSVYLKNRPQNKRRKWLYLGASSTWSFNVRVASIVQVYLGQDSLDRCFQFSLDGDAYTVNWTRVTKEQQPDLSRLPSFDYAMYLTNTVKYHLGGIFHIFDEDHFMRNLREFYEAGPDKIGFDRLWYTQYLTLLAFGKSLLHSKRSTVPPAGTDFFCRAMSILPEMPALHEEPVLAAEVLCLIALYFHCLDMRQTAYSYIGQALRICLVEGMHTNLPAGQIGDAFATRCNSVWWTTYILDRTLSATVGAPTSVNDDHVSSVLPNPTECPTRLATLSLHVKLSRLVSVILTELYSAKGSLESSYLAKTQSVLRHMATIAQEMEQVIDIKFKSSFDTITRAATHLRLLYHQCIILAIRPLLLCLLQDTTRNLERTEHARPITPSTVRDLIQTCSNSATKTLKIINALRSHNMLDYFLPFDLEYTSTASSILIMVDDVLKCVDVPQPTKELASQILDEIADSGNAVALLRRTELQDLGRLAMKLWQKNPPGVDNTAQQRRRGLARTSMTTAIANTPSTTAQVLGNTSNHDNAGDFGNRTDNQQTSRQEYTGNLNPVDLHPALLHDVEESAPLDETNQQRRSVGIAGQPDDDAMTRFSTTSSLDIAHNFDLAYDEMLLLADHIDVDALQDSVDFDLNGDYHWILNNTP